MDLNVPYVVARYELDVLPEHTQQFHEILDSFYEKASKEKSTTNGNPTDNHKAA